MTAPLVPAHVDLRDFPFMPLDVLRLRDSDLATLANGEEFKAAVLLWCVAWHQIPAGSVPNDDRWLARHSGAAGAWKRLKPAAMRGFVECDDGRLYHEVIAEKANESWRKKQEQRARTLKGRIAIVEKRIKEAKTDGEKLHLQTVLRGLLSDLSQMSVTDSATTSNRRDSEGTVKGLILGADAPLSGEPPDDDLLGADPPQEHGTAPPDAKAARTAAYGKDARAVLAFLNDRAGKRFPESDTNVGIIVARFREGFTAAQARKVVAMKVRKWATDPDMREFLRPETLFNRKKFSSYVGELVDVPDDPPDDMPGDFAGRPRDDIHPSGVAT